MAKGRLGAKRHHKRLSIAFRGSSHRVHRALKVADTASVVYDYLEYTEWNLNA